MNQEGTGAAAAFEFIWATRGKTWGFRFLRTAGRVDPLKLYEAAFRGDLDSTETFQKGAATIAIRITDPEGRRDASGRLIPHEFVLLEPLPYEVDSAEEAFKLVWPRVKDDFTRDWDQPKPLR